MKNFFKNTKLVYILLFFLAFGLSLFLQLQTENIPGIDGHFYIKMARMLREKGGLFHEFPWLNFTPFRGNFYGLHWFFYLLLVPFSYFSNLILGVKLATAICFGGITVVFYFLTQSLNFKYSWAGILLLFGLSSNFLIRVHMGRPISLSVIFLLFGLYAILKERYIFLFFTSFFYVWAYDGYIVLTFLCGFWFLVYFAKERRLDFRPLLANVSGIIWGSFLNPYFPEVVLNSHLSHNPLVYRFVSRITPSAEWSTRNIFSNFGAHWLLIILFLGTYVLGFISFFLKDFKKRKRDYLFNAYLWSSVLFFFFLTTLANRFMEYAAPLLALYALFVVNRIISHFYCKVKRVLKEVSKKISWNKEELQWTFSLILIGLLLFGVYQNSRALISSSERSDLARLQGASQWLEENTEKGEIVYNAAWEDFPFLFFHNDHNYYIVGLDAYFLYLYNQEFYFLYQNIADRGKTCSKRSCNLACDLTRDKKIHSVVRNKFNSNYIVVDRSSGGAKRERMREFVRTLKSSGYFEKVFRDSQYDSVYIFKALKNKS